MSESYERRTWWNRFGMTERLKDDAFLEAAVGAAFLIAAADGTASDVENDALIDRLEILGGVDRDRLDDVIARSARAIEEDGFEAFIGRCAELLGERGGAEAALMLAMAVALADDDVSDMEKEIAKQLATAIGLPDVDLGSMLVELRG